MSNCIIQVIRHEVVGEVYEDPYATLKPVEAAMVIASDALVDAAGPLPGAVEFTFEGRTYHVSVEEPTNGAMDLEAARTLLKDAGYTVRLRKGYDETTTE
jgi:ABC-type transport system substrate-binding protein